MEIWEISIVETLLDINLIHIHSHANLFHKYINCVCNICSHSQFLLFTGVLPPSCESSQSTLQRLAQSSGHKTLLENISDEPVCTWRAKAHMTSRSYGLQTDSTVCSSEKLSADVAAHCEIHKIPNLFSSGCNSTFWSFSFGTGFLDGQWPHSILLVTWCR